MSKGPGFFGGSGAGERLGGDLAEQMHMTCRVLGEALKEVEAIIKNHSSEKRELDQSFRLTT